MGQKNQGGSVLSFILIGAALILIFIAGAFVIRQVTTQAPTTQAPAAPGRTETEEDTPTPAPETSVDVQPQQDATPRPNTTQLPQTGPAEQLGVLFVIALLTATSVSYLQSRRLRVSL